MGAACLWWVQSEIETVRHRRTSIQLLYYYYFRGNTIPINAICYEQIEATCKGLESVRTELMRLNVGDPSKSGNQRLRKCKWKKHERKIEKAYRLEIEKLVEGNRSLLKVHFVPFVSKLFVKMYLCYVQHFFHHLFTIYNVFRRNTLHYHHHHHHLLLGRRRLRLLMWFRPGVNWLPKDISVACGWKVP